MLIYFFAGIFLGIGAYLIYAAAIPVAALIGSISVLTGVVLTCTGLILNALKKEK